MAISDHVRMKGYPLIQLFGPDGQEKDRRDCSNLLVYLGMEVVAAKLVEGAMPVPDNNPEITEYAFRYIGVGEGTTDPTVDDVALESELSPRKSITDSVFKPDSKPALTTMVALFEKGESTGALTEAGIFVTSTGDTLTNRVTFPVLNKEPEDILQIAWRLTFDDGKG